LTGALDAGAVALETIFKALGAALAQASNRA